jgi:hypothetical protein
MQTLAAAMTLRLPCSTLVCSLMTGVPIIADNATLGAYTYLHPDHVFLRNPGQDEVDVMLQVGLTSA